MGCTPCGRAAFFATAELAYQKGDLLAAARDARKALGAGAGLKGHLVLAKILLAMDRKSEARAQYEKALALDPRNPSAARGLALTR